MDNYGKDRLVYGIFDMDGVCKYVGNTYNLEQRSKEHDTSAKNNIDKDLYQWMNKNEYEYIIIEDGIKSDVGSIEHSYIDKFDQISPLFNKQRRKIKKTFKKLDQLSNSSEYKQWMKTKKRMTDDELFEQMQEFNTQGCSNN